MTIICHSEKLLFAPTVIVTQLDMQTLLLLNWTCRIRIFSKLVSSLRSMSAFESRRIDDRKQKSSLNSSASVVANNRQRKIAEKDLTGKEKRSSAISAKRLRVENSTIDSHANQTIDEGLDSLSTSDLKLYVDQVKKRHDLAALRNVRNALCRGNWDAIRTVLDLKIIPSLITLLSNKDEELRIEAVWCLTNIATGDYEQTLAVLEAMPQLIQILSSDVEQPNIKEQVCWTIGNIAGECDDFRLTLLANGCLRPLHRCCISRSAKELSLRRTATWALSNLVRGSVPGAPFWALGRESAEDSAAGTSLLHLFREGDEQITTELLWLLAFLTAKDEAESNAYLTALLPELLQVLQPLFSSCQAGSTATIPLIRVLGNLSSGPVEWLEQLLRPDLCVLDAVTRFLLPPSAAFSASFPSHSSKNAELKESMWVLSNLLGGSDAQREAVLRYLPPSVPADFAAAISDSFTLSLVLRGLLSDLWSLQREALFALKNACLSPSAAREIFVTGPAAIGRLPGGPAPGLAAVQCLVRMLRDPVTDPAASVNVLHLLRLAATGSQEGLQLCIDCEAAEAIETLQYSQAGHNGELAALAEATLREMYDRMEDLDGKEEGWDQQSSIHISTNPFAVAAEQQSGEGGSGRGRGRGIVQPAWMTHGFS